MLLLPWISNTGPRLCPLPEEYTPTLVPIPSFRSLGRYPSCEDGRGSPTASPLTGADWGEVDSRGAGGTHTPNLIPFPKLRYCVPQLLPQQIPPPILADALIQVRIGKFAPKSLGTTRSLMRLAQDIPKVRDLQTRYTERRGILSLY